MKKFEFYIGCVLILLLGGCGTAKEETEPSKETTEFTSMTTPSETVEPTTTKENTTEASTEPVNYDLLKPNEIGHIMVVMYHGIADNPPYHRTEDDFKKDLSYMYEHGYRLMSMADYINSNVSVEAGYTPIVLTFDDGLETTFTLEREQGELVPKEGTAIAILEDFVATHPDFGHGACLYINGDASTNFTNMEEGENITFEEYILWLTDHGYEIGNHTYNHLKLNQLEDEEVREEFVKVNQLIEAIIPGYVMDSLSFPFGIRPEASRIDELMTGEALGTKYSFQVGLKEGVSTTMVAPMHQKFQPFNCPRVRGSEGEESDLWWWFDYYEKHPENKYTSDGDKSTVVVRLSEQENVNSSKLMNKRLITYGE